MKKIFFAMMAVAALAACNKSEVIETPQGIAIAFDEVFVDNATKANDLNATNIPDFAVYGTVAKGGASSLIFNNQLVNGTTYTYSPVQYWIGGAQYDFLAFAPKTDAGWVYEVTDGKNAQNGTISFTQSTDANQDFLFAYNKPNVTPEDITSAPEKVAFNFSHMLSRVRFTFTHGFTAGSNIELRVTDVHITDAYKKGTIAVANGAAANVWTPADNSLNIAFGDAGTANITEVAPTASTEHFYLIPADATYNVTFKITLYQAGVLVANYNRTATVAANMLRGNSYDIKATLSSDNTSDDGELFPIEFKVETVEQWGNFSDVNASVNE